MRVIDNTVYLVQAGYVGDDLGRAKIKDACIQIEDEFDVEIDRSIRDYYITKVRGQRCADAARALMKALPGRYAERRYLEDEVLPKRSVSGGAQAPQPPIPLASIIPPT